MRLYGYDLKYVAESSETDMTTVKTAVDAETAKDVNEEGISVTVEPHVLDDMISKSPEPNAKYDIGDHFEVRAVLSAATLDDLKAQLNDDSTNTDSIIQGTRVFQLPQYHLGFSVKLPDGTVDSWYTSFMFLDGSLDAAFQGGENKWYLPVIFTSSADSELDVSNA